jgi:trimeric autotransporter adhesin
MQKKAIALAVAGLISSGAFAVTVNDATVNTFAHVLGTLTVGTASTVTTPTTTPGAPGSGILPTIVDNGDGTSTVFTVTGIGATSTTSTVTTETGSAVVNPNADVTLTEGSTTTASTTTTFDLATSFLVDNATGLPTGAPPVVGVTGIYDSGTGIFTPGPGNVTTTGPDTVSTGGANLTMDGSATIHTNLTVDGTTTTNGISNTGNISTDSLTDGVVTLQNGTLLNTAGHGLEITDNGTILSGGQSASPTSGVLTLNDGDAPGGTKLTIAGSGAGSAVTTVLQVTSQADGSVVNTTIGASTADSTTVIQGGGNNVTVDSTGTTVTGAFTANNGATVNGGLTADTLNVTGVTTTHGIINTGNIGTSTLSTSGLATLNSAQVTNGLTVLGATITNGITNTGTLQNNGNAVVTGTLAAGNTTVNGTLSTTGNASVGGNASVAGTTTLTGALIANGGATINNGATVNGNFTATSNAYLGGSSANATVVVSTSGMTVASSRDVSMGGNRVQNVGNAVAGTDAVNLNQLHDVRKEARRGIAGAAALAGLPALESGKQYNFGAGVGYYKGESALSLGGHARIDADTTAKFGVGITGSDATVSAGIGWSF